MSDTRQQIMDVATGLVQEKGYNAFSYNDIAVALGIRKASIHYHFPTKPLLVKTIMANYREQHSLALTAINRRHDHPVQRLKAFAGLFSKTLGEDYVMCPSGMLASEVSSLPDEVLEEVHGFFTDSEDWLVKVLNDGVKQGQFQFSGKTRDQARSIFASFEGALLTARAFNDKSRLTAASRQIINSILVKN